MRIAWALAPAVALLVLLTRAAADAPILIVVSPAEQFAKWTALATAHPVSEATAEKGDRTLDWTAPDGRPVHLVVKIPHPRAEAGSVTLPGVPDGVDARPYFESALARVREEKAAHLLIPKGTYVFKSLGAGRLGHLIISDLRDVTIDGSGSTLVFEQDADGIYLASSQRVRITRLNLEYSLHMASLAQTRATPDGYELVIDRRFPVSAADAVTYVSEYDPIAKSFAHNGQRAILPPGSAPAQFVGNQTFRSPAFKQLKPGKTFVVFHQWYGGVGLKISDLPDRPPSQDVTLDGITIYSGPGMGIVAYGMKRGLAIVNCVIEPKPDGSSPISTEYDAIHVLIAGGDVIIADNRISGQGDDAINFSSAMQPVVTAEPQGARVTLSAYSRFIRPGETLAFFSGSGDFIGSAAVSSVKPLGGLNNEITLSERVPGLSTAVAARDLQLLNSRYALERNAISDCHCHGILLEAPFGLADNNTITNTAYNGIRLLTGLGPFKEGVGAFDVIVRENQITGTGGDDSLRFPWAAITAYGVTRANTPAESAVHADLQIVDNEIADVPQGCITVTSTRRASVAGNHCDRRAGADGAVSAITVRSASQVTLSANRLTGDFAGKIDVDPQSTSGVTGR